MHKEPKPGCATASWIRKEPGKPKESIKGKNGGPDISQDQTDKLESRPGMRSVLIFEKKDGKNYMYEADIHAPVVHINAGEASFGVYEGGRAILGGKVSFEFKGMIPGEKAVVVVTVHGSEDACILMLDAENPTNITLPGIGNAKISLHPKTMEITKEVVYEPVKKPGER